MKFTLTRNLRAGCALRRTTAVVHSGFYHCRFFGKKHRTAGDVAVHYLTTICVNLLFAGGRGCFKRRAYAATRRYLAWNIIRAIEQHNCVWAPVVVRLTDDDKHIR